MKFAYSSAAIGVFACGLSLLSVSGASAQMLTVLNPSFETPALTDNMDALFDNTTAYNYTSVLGNSPAFGGSTGQHAGIENPSGKFTGDTTGTGSLTGAGGDGVQAAFMNLNGSGGNVTITTAASLATVILGTQYTLTAAVGNPTGGGTSLPGSFTIALLVNGTAATNFTLTNANTAVADSSFADFSTTFTATAAQSGGALTAQLFGVNQGTGNNNSQIFFDNIRVSEVVPEPSTWALMLCGAGLLVAIGARRVSAKV
jgi:hypothetical protein